MQGGGNRWLSRNKAQGLLLSAHSLNLSGGPWPSGAWLSANAALVWWESLESARSGLCRRGLFVCNVILIYTVVRAGEAAKSVKCLPCMHEALDSTLRTTSHILDMVDQVCNPNTCGGRRIKIAQHPSPIHREFEGILGYMRHPLKKGCYIGDAV